MKHTIKNVIALVLLLTVAMGMLSCAKIKKWALGADTTAPVTTNTDPAVDPLVQAARRKLCYSFLVLTEGKDGIGTLRTLSYAVIDVNGDHTQLGVIQFPKETFINNGTVNSLNGLYEKTYADSITNGFDPQTALSRAITELRTVFAQDLMLPCDYYLYLTSDGIASIVDDLDGVELPVPFFMNFEDGSYISTGIQKLTGTQASSMLYYHGYGDGSLQNAAKVIFSAIFMKMKTLIKDDVLPLFMIELREAVKTDISIDAGSDVYFVRKILNLPADRILMTSAPTRLVPLLGGNVSVISSIDTLEKINGFITFYSEDLTAADFDKNARFNDIKDPYVSSVYASSGMSKPIYSATDALAGAVPVTK